MTPAADSPNYWLGWSYRKLQVGSTHKYSRVLSAISHEDRRRVPDLSFAKSFSDSWALLPILNGGDLVMCLDDIVSLHNEDNRRNTVLWDEICLQHSAGVISTSEGFKPFVDEVAPGTPFCWLPLKPSLQEMDYEPCPKKKPKTAVYTGGIIAPQMRKTTQGEYDYRDWTELFKEVIDAGWEMHVYFPLWAHKTTIKHYLDLGCVMHGFVPMEDLPKTMSQYEVGIQGFREIHNPYVEVVTPNKTWEYLSAGIPTLGIGYTGIASTIYEPGGWGTTRREGESMKDALERAAAIPITRDLMESQAIELHIPEVKEFLTTIDRTKSHPHSGFTYEREHFDAKKFVNFKRFPNPRFVIGVDEDGSA